MSNARPLHAFPGAVRRPAPAPDGLSANQRRAVVAGILTAHIGALWAVLQVPAVRESVVQAAPIFVNLLAPPAPPTAPPVPAPPPPPVVKPVIKPPKRELVTAPPAPAPVPFEAPAPEPPPPLPVVVAEAPPVVSPPAPPAPPPPPPQIPASEVQYLVKPAPEYPRMSVRLGEEGRVLVRTYVDEAGMPRMVQVIESSGFPRLDEAAVLAVQRARFKPYMREGVPTAGWARIPIPFELER